MGLPNAENASIDVRKLTEYCLSPSHPVGKHKAAVFWRALGLSVDDVDMLREWLRQAAMSGQAVAERADKFGQRFSLDFAARTPLGSATIRSAWIVRSGEDFPRLVTCYVLSQ